MVDLRGWLSVTRGNTANAAEALGVGSVDLVWLSRESDSAITRPWDKGVDSFHWPCGQNPGRKPEGSRRAFCARGEEPRRTEFDLQGQYLSRQRRRPG